MDEEQVAELVARTLQWAIDRCHGIAAIKEVDFHRKAIWFESTFGEDRYVLTVQKVQD